MQKIFKYIVVLLVAAGLFNHQQVQAQEQALPHDRIYTIVVDRFMSAGEDNDVEAPEEPEDPLPFGGDFQGIQNNLEYIQNMGFNTLMLSPVFEKDDEDYLGYDVESYEEISEAFGGAEALQSLVDAAHERGMKVVVDMPATATEGYTTLSDPVLNEVQEVYYEDVDTEFIDLADASNQETYQENAQSFVDQFDIDGLSMTVVQDGIDAADFMPEGVTTYAVVPDGSISAQGFDHTSSEEMRESLAEAFSTTDTEIPDYPEDGALVLADHWFTERFTMHAVEANMFPGTRVRQLVTYLYAYPGPIAVQYGTEIALNGETYPLIHRQMDLWTDQEVAEYMEQVHGVFLQHQSIFDSEIETLKNEAGNYILRYHTSDVDFILNVNDTSETEGFNVPLESEDKGKMLSGLLIGDNIRISDQDPEHFYSILDREETELYAIIEEQGFNNGYIYAALIIFGGFGIFIWLVARRRPPKEERK